MLKKISNAIENFEVDEIAGLVSAAKAQGLSAKEILDEGLLKGMDEVGKKFAAGDVFVPEVLMAAETMQAGVAVIKAELQAGGNDAGRGVVVIGTVKGDLHDIGKKLVAMMIEGAGYKVIDLGVDVPAETFISAAKEHDADFVGMSAMLTTTMTEMQEIVKRMQEEGIRALPLVGGAPVSEGYAKTIGAHYSHDAANAVELVKSLS